MKLWLSAADQNAIGVMPFLLNSSASQSRIRVTVPGRPDSPVLYFRSSNSRAGASDLLFTGIIAGEKSVGFMKIETAGRFSSGPFSSLLALAATHSGSARKAAHDAVAASWLLCAMIYTSVSFASVASSLAAFSEIVQ